MRTSWTEKVAKEKKLNKVFQQDFWETFLILSEKKRRMIWKVVLEKNHKHIFKKESKERSGNNLIFVAKERMFEQNLQQKKRSSGKFKNTFLNNPVFFYILFFSELFSCYFSCLVFTKSCCCSTFWSVFSAFFKVFCQHRFICFIFFFVFFLLIPFFWTLSWFLFLKTIIFPKFSTYFR